MRLARLVLLCILPASAAGGPRVVSLWPFFHYEKGAERTEFG